MSDFDHELKTIQPYFDAVASGAKTFEIRYDDRNYQIGQRLWLREYDYETDTYPGQSVYADITYVTDYHQDRGYVVLGIHLTTARQPVPGDEELLQAFEDASIAAVKHNKEHWFGPEKGGEYRDPDIAGIRAVRDAILAGRDLAVEIPEWVESFRGAYFDEPDTGTQGYAVVITNRNHITIAGEGHDWSEAFTEALRQAEANGGASE